MPAATTQALAALARGFAAFLAQPNGRPNLFHLSQMPARDDLRDIVRFIARDNPQRAESFGYELMTRTDILHEHPEAGRMVPDTAVREFARLSIDHIGSSIASISSVK